MENKELLNLIFIELKKIYFNSNYLELSINEDAILNIFNILDWLLFLKENNKEIKKNITLCFNVINALVEIDELSNFIFKYKLGINDNNFLENKNNLFSKSKIGNYITRVRKSNILDDNFFLNEIQKEILENLNKNNIVISAPTSVGKTFLLRRFAINKLNNFDCVIFVLPTLALINEYYNSYINENVKNIEIIPIFKKNTILLLTQERAVQFLSKYSEKNIYFIFDEIYSSIANQYNSRSLLTIFLIKNAINKNFKTSYILPNIKNMNTEINKIVSSDKIEEYFNDSFLTSQLIYFWDLKKNEIFYSKVTNSKNDSISNFLNGSSIQNTQAIKKLLSFKKKTIVYINSNFIYEYLENLEENQIFIENDKIKIVKNYIKNFITDYEYL